MFEFEVIEEIKSNIEMLEILKNCTLTILEYKVNEISSKPFYVKEHKQKYNLMEIKQILIKLKI